MGLTASNPCTVTPTCPTPPHHTNLGKAAAVRDFGTRLVCTVVCM